MRYDLEDSMQTILKQCPAEAEVLRPFLAGADHTDVKRVDGSVPLDRFILGMFSYFPWWLRRLYRVRAGLVKLLGLQEQHTEAEVTDLIPRQVSFRPADQVLFFTVRKAKEACYWIAETPEDKHLKAYLAIFAEHTGNTSKRFHVFTIVHYKHWTGPVYFNLIRPFHHLVVSRMARAGVTASEALETG